MTGNTWDIIKIQTKTNQLIMGNRTDQIWVRRQRQRKTKSDSSERLFHFVLYFVCVCVCVCVRACVSVFFWSPRVENVQLIHIHISPTVTFTTMEKD